MIDRSIPKSSMLSESPSIGISNPEVHPSIGTSPASCGCAVLLLRLSLCAVLLLRLSIVVENSASNIRASYGRITCPNCVHQYDILFLTHDHYRGKKYKAVLNIIDCASRYKASVPLTSKNSSEVAKTFRKVYGDRNNPLTWPKLLQCDNGREWMGETFRLMQDHDVTIQVIGPYSHCKTAIVERFNQTLSKILYKIQYAVESISSDPGLMRAWVRYLPEAIDYLN